LLGSSDRGEAELRPACDAVGAVNGRREIGAEQLLRGLAGGDETSLQSVLVLPPAGRPPRAPATRTLPPATTALIDLAALLATGGSTTSLRWSVERALRAGVQDEQIVEVLAAVAATVGSARVVAAAPRLALAIGYDIEVEGWDGL
jgi:4-carboxymuconolactone decarboxylase